MGSAGSNICIEAGPNADAAESRAIRPIESRVMLCDIEYLKGLNHGQVEFGNGLLALKKGVTISF